MAEIIRFDHSGTLFRIVGTRFSGMTAPPHRNIHLPTPKKKKLRKIAPRISLITTERISKFIESREKILKPCGLTDICKNLNLNVYTCKKQLQWLVNYNYIQRTNSNSFAIITPFRVDDFILAGEKEKPAYPSYTLSSSGNGMPRYSLKKIELIYNAVKDSIDYYGFSAPVGEIAANTSNPKSVVWTCLKWLVDNDYLARVKFKANAIVIKKPFDPELWRESFLFDKKISSVSDPIENTRNEEKRIKKLSEMGIDHKFHPCHYKISFGEVKD